MSELKIFISRISAWAPGVVSETDWREWALGRKEISFSDKGPELSFAEPMFRRRLSQISKMTIQVVHDLMPVANDVKLLFSSFRGELSRQFQINKMIIEEKTVSPAIFSLSVFNAPVALATIALGLKGGYSAIYIKEKSFSTALKTAEAALLGGSAKKLIFIYADEKAQKEYECFFNEAAPAVSFALLLSKESDMNSIPFTSTAENPFDFLKQLFLLQTKMPLLYQF